VLTVSGKQNFVLVVYLITEIEPVGILVTMLWIPVLCHLLNKDRCSI
jgi:hypothetical protein